MFSLIPAQKSTTHGPVRIAAFAAFTALAAMAGLTSCGGGSGSTLEAAAAPTALADNSATATTLATETRRALALSQSVAGLPLPGARSVLSAVLTSTTTVACAFGGSWTHDVPPLPLPATDYHVAFQQCAFADQQPYQGTYTVRYSSFTSLDSVNWSGSFNLSLAVPGQPVQQLVGTHECTTQNSTVNCTVHDGQRSYSGSLNYGAGHLQGSYVWHLGQSTGNTPTDLTLNYSNWTTVGGTATVTGPAGFSATVLRTGANSFTVTIQGGQPYSITLTG